MHTIATRLAGIDDAGRHCEVYREEGADSLLLLPYVPEAVLFIGERLAPPLAAYEAVKKVYAELADGFAIRSRPQEDWARLQKEQQASVDMDKLIEIERRTTERPGAPENGT